MNLPAFRRGARALVALSLSATVLALGACHGGGGGSSSPPVMPEAFGVFGQADFISGQPNRGGVVGGTGLAQPRGGVATNGTKLYIADTNNSRVLGWNSLPTFTGSAVAPPPDFVLGQPDFNTNTPGTSATKMAFPNAVTISGTTLVVADTGNNRVLIWNVLPSGSGGVVTPPDTVIGQGGFTTNDPGLTATTLNNPVDATVAGTRLIVADQNNNRVLIYPTPLATGEAATVALGQPDSCFTGTPPTTFLRNNQCNEQAGMTGPSAVWSDGFRLLVSDAGNNRVLYWTQVPRDNTSDASINASFAIGQIDFARFSSGTSSQTLFTPTGLSSDGTRIFVADTNNNRVLEFDSFPIASGAAATTEFGQSTFSRRTADDDNQDGVQDLDANNRPLPSARTLSSPAGVLIFNNVLYVTDQSNHRVLLFPG